MVDFYKWDKDNISSSTNRDWSKKFLSDTYKDHDGGAKYQILNFLNQNKTAVRKNI